MPNPVLMAQAIGIAAFLAVIISWSLGRSGVSGGAVGVGLGVFAGAWVLGLTPQVPPRGALDRLQLILIPAIVLTEVVITSRTWWVGWVLRATVAVLAAPLLVYGSSYVTDLSGPGSREWTTGIAAAIFTSLAAVLMLVWILLTQLATQASRSATIAVAITAAGTAVTMMLSGYATGGQLGLPLAAAVGVIAFSDSRHASGAVAVAIVTLFSLLVIGRLFAGLTTLHAVGLFATPLLACVPDLPQLRQWGPRTRATLRVVLTAVPVVLVLWLAQQKFAEDSGPSSEGSSNATFSDYLDYSK
ncbi:MAG: hypothetical protein JWP89_6464 [Schlesneria sp.]|nr:hypothetical protein [Schlesneria sp.]